MRNAQAVGGSREQLLFIARQPLAFLGILWSSLWINLAPWTYQSIGALGWIQVSLPRALYLLVLVAVPGFMLRMREEVHLRLRQRALLAAVGVTVFLTIAVALYAFLEPLGSDRVMFQGRYLAPVWLLLLLSVYGIKFARQQLGVPLLIGVLLMVMAQNLQTLVWTYWT